MLVNNAGYGLAGGVEEVSEQEARDQFEANVFGALWCSQAVLPVMRRQGSGHLFQVSSIGGVAGFPGTGLYHASKWALEGFSESLAQEVAGFGVGVTIVEPGPFRTDWNGDSMTRATPMPEYDEVLGARRDALSGAHARTQVGDPRRAGEALLKVLASDAPPRRLLLGAMAADTAPRVYAQRLEEWAAWEERRPRRRLPGRRGLGARSTHPRDPSQGKIILLASRPTTSTTSPSHPSGCPHVDDGDRHESSRGSALPAAVASRCGAGRAGPAARVRAHPAGAGDAPRGRREDRLQALPRC